MLFLGQPCRFSSCWKCIFFTDTLHLQGILAINVQQWPCLTFSSSACQALKVAWPTSHKRTPLIWSGYCQNIRKGKWCLTCWGCMDWVIHYQILKYAQWLHLLPSSGITDTEEPEHILISRCVYCVVILIVAFVTWVFFISAIINMNSMNDGWYGALKETTQQQQNQLVWVSEGRVRTPIHFFFWLNKNTLPYWTVPLLDSRRYFCSDGIIYQQQFSPTNIGFIIFNPLRRQEVLNHGWCVFLKMIAAWQCGC